MRIVTAAIAGLVILSPAYAAHKKAAPPKPHQECVSPGGVLADTSKSFRLVTRLDGDALAKFKAKIKDIANGHVTDGVDAVMVFQMDSDTSMVVSFIKGCASEVGVLSNKLLAKLLEDGSI